MIDCETLYCFQGYFSKNTKNNSEKEEKVHFGPNFEPILTNLGKIGITVIVKVLKSKVALLDQGIH